MTHLAPESDALQHVGAQLPGGRIDVRIDQSVLAPDALFTFAARNNPRRAFLFLSRVLGKHLPVRPQHMREIHQRLADRIPALPEPVVFVGMAETATALGQGVFEAWRARHHEAAALYLHTTRYRIEGLEPIGFAEPHSHAPRQLLFLPCENTLRERFAAARSVVLIDDEISTGQTFQNLAAACRTQPPALEHVHLAAITDFMGAQARSALRARIGCRHLTVGSLLSGAWQFTPDPTHQCSPTVAQTGAGAEARVERNDFGRLGRDAPLHLAPAPLQRIAASICDRSRVLVLGTGEFMYPAYVLARELNERHGIDTVTQASTRSPILLWGQIERATTFPDNYGEGVANYLYNCGPDDYDQVLVCHETGPTPGLRKLTALLGGRSIHFRSETDFAEDILH